MNECPMPRSMTTRRLLTWFAKAKRALPWRENRTPYSVWISEIMLQQTRVSTVIPYYERFLARFPDVAALARASEQDVLAHWAGLGYYSRGRNLRRAAQTVVREHAGNFPTSARELRSLPGVGEYTAAAVGSIAFGEPVAVMDGNVERVLCRLHAIDEDPKAVATRQRLRQLAQDLVPAKGAGTFNEAMMELGALVCTPRAPQCDACPVRSECLALRGGDPTRYPRPRAKRSAETQHWVAALVRSEHGYWLVEAPPEAELLPGHWGVPLARAPRSESSPRQLMATARELARESFGHSLRGGVAHPPVRHAITYRRLVIHPVELIAGQEPPGEVRVCRPGERNGLAALHRKALAAACTTEKRIRTQATRKTKTRPRTSTPNRSNGNRP